MLAIECGEELSADPRRHKMVLRPSQNDSLLDKQERIALLKGWAARLLVSERGWTPLCRMKLVALAADIGLSEEDVEHALKSMSTPAESADAIHVRDMARSEAPGISSAPPKISDQQREKFRRYLRKKLRKLVSQILPPDQERRLLSIAWKRHALGESEARRCVIEISESMGIRRLTLDELRAHLSELIASQVGDSTSLDSATWQRLIFIGQTWRLDALAVRQIVSEQLDANAHSQRTALIGGRLAVGGLSLIVAALTIAVIALTIERRSTFIRPDGLQESTAEASTDRPSFKVRTTVLLPDAPAWWDADLRSVVSDIQAAKRWRLPLENLGDPDPRVRAGHYVSLIESIRESPADLGRDDRWAELLGGLHALEPDDQAAQQLRERLLPLSRISSRELPTRLDEYPWAFRSMGFALQARERAGEGRGRRAALSERMQRRLQLPVPAADDKIRREEVGRDLSLLLFEQLTTGAVSQPEWAARHYAVLSPLTRSKLSPVEFERLNVELLEVVLPTIGSASERWRELIDVCGNATNADCILRVVGLLERIADHELADYLGSLLLRRMAVDSVPADYQDLADTVRARLQLKSASPATGDPRVSQLRERIDHLRLDFATSDRADNLQQAVHVAQVATMAWALQQSESTWAEFDRLVKQPMQRARTRLDEASLIKPTGRPHAPLRSAQVIEQHRRQLTVVVQKLKNHEKASAGQRQSSFVQLAQLVKVADDLTLEQGATIAKSLLAVRNRNEMRLIDAHLATVCASAQVRLGIADYLAQATMPRAELQQLLEIVLVRKVTAEELAGERDAIRYEILARVAREIDTVHEEAPWDPLLDSAQAVFRETYLERLRIAGLEAVLTEDAREGGSIGFSLLEPLIKQISVVPARVALPPEARRYVDRVPHELIAIRSLDTYDLESTVLLQRVLVRTLQISVLQRVPDRAGESGAILRWLEQRDGKAEQVFKQLQDGEVAILRLLCLLGPSDLHNLRWEDR